ncbi:Peptidoglycan/LPS O-acetylase OafA/YrhL, contains acyltransferase and SGNH-hydrolase domains [Bryocella elongata]|uniref:Peptidoglycan/LPS O-acetylase OafA/YrhL, contains acyltransferase and SGNH-hydrolase domains n=1 Tax=Bryocella elongata TaxID=863522 RepID=A0A1H5Z7U6_9BACT|nr:acyltransferase [Bryocella elongata]SEG32372.1 Peptidoglycan/LPS O-acetylase OafA/YrhL, contains acyltransferase and SGNH-hydrolase domains [Bryocella elongata]
MIAQQPRLQPGLEALEKNVPGGTRPSYLPTLDGWRAIAILLVLLNHSVTLGGEHFNTATFHYFGPIGVEIFFELSGLLICNRLLDEERLTGSLNLKGFYVRRIFRIQPLALLYVTVVVGLTLLHRIPNFPAGIASAYLLVRNFVGMRAPAALGWATAHFWSLSVEEHFYLFLPSFLLFVRRRRAEWILALGSAGVLWRTYQYVSHGNSLPFAIDVRTDLSLCFLLIPASFAVLLQRPAMQAAARRYLRLMWVLPLALLALPPISPLHPISALVDSLLIVTTLTHPTEWYSRVLELPPLQFLGRISYSIYVWQELFLSNYWTRGQVHAFGRLNQSPWVVLLVFPVAIASYYGIEKPLIRLGHRLAPSATPGRAL